MALILKLCIFLLPGFTSAPVSEASIDIKLDNFYPKEGKIILAVFDNQDGFLKEAYNGYCFPVEEVNEGKLKLGKLPKGTYSISIFHDQNNNGKLDKSFLGIPKEPFGFSNNPSISFGPPTFQQTSFEISGDIEVEIKLRKLGI